MKIKLNKKKTSLIIVLILLVFLTGNAFAALAGIPNIFFAIKDMVVQEEVKGEEDLLSDRDITISYSPIKIKEGLEIQVNRILIEEGKSTLFVTLQNKNEKDEQLGINVYDLLENNNINDVLSEDKFLIKSGTKKSYGLELSKKVSTDEKLKLEIIIGGKSVGRNIIVDLASKEIVIEGTEEVKKISEVELKEYLGCFSILNDKTLKMNDRLLYIAERMNSEIFKDQIESNSQREMMMNIIDSFYTGIYTTETVKEKEILKANKQQYNYDAKLDAYTLVTDGGELPRGICLNIEDISYKSGIYTVDFIYVHPTIMDIEEDKVEDLTQYKATIELELNEDSEYSKYKVLNLTEGEEIEKKDSETEESKINANFSVEMVAKQKLLCVAKIEDFWDGTKLTTEQYLNVVSTALNNNWVKLKNQKFQEKNSKNEFVLTEYEVNKILEVIFGTVEFESKTAGNIRYEDGTFTFPVLRGEQTPELEGMILNDDFKLREDKLNSISPNLVKVYKQEGLKVVDYNLNLVEENGDSIYKGHDTVILSKSNNILAKVENYHGIEEVLYGSTEEDYEIEDDVVQENIISTEAPTETSIETPTETPTEQIPEKNEDNKEDKVLKSDDEVELHLVAKSEIPDKESPLKSDKFISSLDWLYFGCSNDDGWGTTIPFIKSWDYHQNEELEESTKIRGYVRGDIEKDMNLSVYMHDPIKIDKNTTKEQIIDKLINEGGIGNVNTKELDGYTDTHGREYIVLSHDWIFDNGDNIRNIYYSRTVENPNGEIHVYYVRFTYSYKYLENEKMDKVIKYMLDGISFI